MSKAPYECETCVGGEGSLSTISARIDDLQRIGDGSETKLLGAMTPRDTAAGARRAVFRVIPSIIQHVDGMRGLLDEFGSSDSDLVFAGMVKATANTEWVDPKTGEIVKNPSVSEYRERGLRSRIVREVTSVSRGSVSCKKEYGHDGIGNPQSNIRADEVLGVLSMECAESANEAEKLNLICVALKEAIQRLIGENLR